MKQKWVMFIGIFAIFLSVFWIAGLGLTFNYYFSQNTTAADTPLEMKEEDRQGAEENGTRNGYHVIALGDSLTVGIGAENEIGYIETIVEALSKQREEDVYLQNFAVSGLTSDGLVTILQTGTVTEEIKNADIIFLTIGGNDLFQRGQTLVDLNLEVIASIRQQFLQNIATAFNQIRQLNSNATIYFSGLYHPFTHLPNVDLTTNVIMDWNYQTALTIAEYNHTVFIPMYDLFQLNLHTFLSEDGFHPSSEGYLQMANRIIPLINLDGGTNE